MMDIVRTLIFWRKRNSDYLMRSIHYVIHIFFCQLFCFISVLLCLTLNFQAKTFQFQLKFRTSECCIFGAKLYVLFLFSCKTPGVHQKFREKIGALLVSYDSTNQHLIVVVSHLKLEKTS